MQILDWSLGLLREEELVWGGGDYLGVDWDEGAGLGFGAVCWLRVVGGWKVELGAGGILGQLVGVVVGEGVVGWGLAGGKYQGDSITGDTVCQERQYTRETICISAYTVLYTTRYM